MKIKIEINKEFETQVLCSRAKVRSEAEIEV